MSEIEVTITRVICGPNSGMYTVSAAGCEILYRRCTPGRPAMVTVTEMPRDKKVLEAIIMAMVERITI